MAFIIGLTSPEERAELERRGWDVETCPHALVLGGDTNMTMVWVDNDLFDIMSGPDWDKGPDKP
jgi:hypothetical protein